MQDTFGRAGDGTSISIVDADGVALAAIWGLNAKLPAQNAERRAQLARLEAALRALGGPPRACGRPASSEVA